MTKTASLKVEGSSGSQKEYNTSHPNRGNGGGGGGLIQIDASRGQLYNLSLAAGTSYRCNISGTTSKPEHGCLVVESKPCVNKCNSAPFCKLCKDCNFCY
jgi:hypothetical protein